MNASSIAISDRYHLKLCRHTMERFSLIIAMEEIGDAAAASFPHSNNLVTAKLALDKQRTGEEAAAGSVFYDSFEVRAVCKQLNRAIRGSSGSPLSPYSYYLRFHLDKKGRGKPRRLAPFASVDGKSGAGGGGGSFGQWLWKKVKSGFLGFRRNN